MSMKHLKNIWLKTNESSNHNLYDYLNERQENTKQRWLVVFSKTEIGFSHNLQIWEKNVNMYFDQVNSVHPCSIKGNVKFMCAKSSAYLIYNVINRGTFLFC